MSSLDFEKPIDELQNKIEELKQLSIERQVDLSDEISKIEKRASKLKKEVFSNLSPKQILQIARHDERPCTLNKDTIPKSVCIAILVCLILKATEKRYVLCIWQKNLACLL